MAAASMLIIFGGLPGVGKTSIARELARQVGAVHLRIDSIEQAIRDSGTVNGPLRMAVATRAQVGAVEVEVRCSDPERHRRRLETRPTDISEWKPPTWEEVVSREYEPWTREHIVIDTTEKSVAESLKELWGALAKR